MMPSWSQAIVPALLMAARWSGLLLAAPFFSSSAVPARVKAGLVLALTLVFWPVAGAAALPRSLLGELGAGVSELVIGVLLGLALQVVVEAATLAGNVAGFQLGLGLETAIDPTSNADSTVLATLHQLVVILLMLELGVHREMLRALAQSFQMLPLGAPLASATAAQLLAVAGWIWIWGLQMVMPILMVTLTIDIALAFFAKAAPQLPVIFIGIPVKLLVGYAVLILAARYWPAMVGDHARQMLQFFLARAHAAG